MLVVVVATGTAMERLVKAAARRILEKCMMVVGVLSVLIYGRMGVRCSDESCLRANDVRQNRKSMMDCRSRTRSVIDDVNSASKCFIWLSFILFE